MVSEIPGEPVIHIAAGLFTILLLVLILPFKFRKIEENLEPFFLVMGIIAVTVSGLWSAKLIEEAVTAPVSIGGLPIGIFQVVLLAGIVIYRFNAYIYSEVSRIMRRLGVSKFVFLMITVLSLLSSLISVIVTAVILVEIIAALPLDRRKKIDLTVITCFAVGLGAALTPVGEPLSTIAVSKLKSPPYNADFLFLFHLLGIYVIPGIIGLAIFGSLYIRKHTGEVEVPEYTESLRTVIQRAIKVYMFVSALILFGGGLTPLVIWYFIKIPPQILYWVNMVSAVLDNATLTAAEIAPQLSISQIKSALIALLISGGMLIPGNIPNIVAAGRLRIGSREWARIGIPLGLILMSIYFLILMFEGVH
ncbi:MAG TPA: DUF1646 domain-containing protein [Archaeoglobaceae archaeon]|nr:DUF1646 domain-containing protein [Archaeoglobaceae archaeon]